MIWDLDWASYDADGMVKLSCIDTGIGMSADELKRYINHLSASRHEQSLTGNFGIGAKVAAAPRNPHGIVYVSWKDGEGSMIQLCRDASDRQVGPEAVPSRRRGLRPPRSRRRRRQARRPARP